MSGIFRGSEEEVVERTLAAERQIAVLEADLADLRVHHRFLMSLLASEQRRRWLPELKGLLLGGALVFLAPLGLVILAGLLGGLFSLLG
jgi:hypothetical protein